MSDYKYHLLKYAGKASRLTCPACERPHCFSPYVDEAGEVLDPTVGRCDHEGSCGYHKTPAEYFKEHPELNRGPRKSSDYWGAGDWRYDRHARPDRASHPVILSAAKNLCFIPADIVNRSVRTNYDSTLVTFLRTLFPPETVTRLITDYRLGVAKDRSAIFFQLDIQGRCRGGKIIQYNPVTGHRIKDDSSKIPVDWIHPRLKKDGIIHQNWTMTQCLFGEHLLPKYPDATVVLVEAEKTAVIGAGFVPEFVWVATGGRSGVNSRIDILEGRQILVFPDVDAFDYWKEKLSRHPRLQCYISDYLQRVAGPDNPTADIADYLVEYKTLPCHPEQSEGSVSPSTLCAETPIHPIQQILNNPEVAALIADLDLQIKSITKLKINEL